MTNSSPWYRWPIYRWFTEINSMVDLSMAILNNQMFSIYIPSLKFSWIKPQYNKP